MSFNLAVKVETAAAESALGRVESGLDKTTAATGRARDALGRFARTGADAGAQVAAGAEKAAAGHAKAKAAAEEQGDAIGRLIHIAEAYIAVHQFEAIIDGYVEVRNKINAVSESHDNLNGQMEATFRIAQATRSNWEEVGAAYQRIATATRGLGLSQRQALDLTEELSMGMRLSGSNSREAAMTMGELTHALTTGTLTGREFKVMMKDAPALMHELQVVSGHTGGEFAEMGKKGKLTGEVLIDLFSKAGPVIKAKFGDTLPTISEGFTLIRNAAEKFFGDAAVGTGVLGQLSAAMRFVADHFDTFGRAALAVGEALVIDKIIMKVKALTIALAENPLTALLVVLTVVISLLRQFGDQMETTIKAGTGFVTVADTLHAVWEELQRLGKQVIEFVDESWNRLTDAFGSGINTDGLESSTTNASTIIAKFVVGAVGVLHYLGDTVITIFGGIPASIGEVFVQMARSVVLTVEKMVNEIIAGINILIEAKNKLTGGGVMVPDQTRLNSEKWARDMNAKYHLGGNAVGVGMTDADVAQRQSGFRAAQAAGYSPTAAGFAPGQAPFGGGAMVASNLIKPVDLNFSTALDGAAAAFDRKIQEDWKKDVTDGIARVGAEAVKQAQQRQLDSYMNYFVNKGKGDGVSDVHGKREAKPADEEASNKAAAAFLKLENQLRAVKEASSPVTSAQEKLAQAQIIVNKAIEASDPVTHKQLLSYEAGKKIMEDYARAKYDELHPQETWIRQQTEGVAALRDTAAAQQIATEMIQYETQMKKENTVVTAAMRLEAEVLLERKQKLTTLMRDEQQLLESINGPMRNYTEALAAANALKPQLTTQQYAQAIDKAKVALLSATPAGQTFAGGMQLAFLKAKADAEGFGATIANTLVGDVEKLSDAFVTMANGGKVAWGDMVSSMIQDIERLILKQLELKIAGSLFSGGGGEGGSAAGVGTALSSIAPSAIDAFTVARTAPGAYASAPARPASNAASQSVTIVNQMSREVPLAAIDSPAGTRTVLNVLRANPGAVRSYSGTRR